MPLRRLVAFSSCGASAFNGISFSVANQVWTHVTIAHGANGVMQVRVVDMRLSLWRGVVLCGAVWCVVLCLAADAGLLERRADSVGDVRRAADVELWCVALAG